MTGSELIDSDTHYQLTKYGLSIRILCVDAPGVCPVVGIDDSGAVHKWNKYGIHPIDAGYNLVHQEFKIDTPVLYKYASGEPWLKGHYAGKNANGAFCVWMNGATSWSTKCRIHVPLIYKPASGELE